MPRQESCSQPGWVLLVGAVCFQPSRWGQHWEEAVGLLSPLLARTGVQGRNVAQSRVRRTDM